MAAEKTVEGGGTEELWVPAGVLKDQTHNCTCLGFCACAVACVHVCVWMSV